MQLFAFDEEVGAGLPLWLPNGTVLIEELEKLAKEREFQAGYQRVKTPHIAKRELFTRSGHIPLYEESMFPPMVFIEPLFQNSNKIEITDSYYLKAMNCPHHHKIFGAVPRSYRELPLRFAEYGTCYRYESAGSLMGLMRVRSMQMNDAHIYCRDDQFETEFKAVYDMTIEYLQDFEIDDYVVRFSLHDAKGLGKKYVNEPELWKQTEDMIRKVLDRAGIDNYVEVPGEAAFYGPKIDILVRAEMGREFTLATFQVDFAVPKKFNLEYRDKDNTLKTPICIHRAPLGTHERFIAFLIEKYQGKFPLWLAPEQVRVLTIRSDDMIQDDYARGVEKLLRQHGIRATLDRELEPISAKVQRAELDKVHTIFVIGNREAKQDLVAVRSRGVNQGPQVIYPVLTELKRAIAERENK